MRHFFRRHSAPFWAAAFLGGVLLAFGALCLWARSPLEGISLADARKYKQAETLPTTLASRAWMVHAMEIVKRSNFPPVTAGRFYAYVASVFADVLEATGDPAEASRATRAFLETAIPQFKSQHSLILSRLNARDLPLSEKARKITEEYLLRRQSDNYELQLSGGIPPGEHRWYVRDGKMDRDAMAGQWKPWIISPEDAFDVPPPPAIQSLADRLELSKVEYAVSARTIFDLPTVYIWHGSTGFEKGAAGDNITPAGVWQNILFIETENELAEKEYARAQKVLAQTIADAFIAAWRVKYEHWSERPSMRIPRLHLAVGDPPFPGYVSGHSTISAAAATVLGRMLPDKAEAWDLNARDAKNSRLLAGIHFDADNDIGEYLGRQVGARVLEKLYGAAPAVEKPTAPSAMALRLELFRFRMANAMNRISARVAAAWTDFSPLPAFRNDISAAGLGDIGVGTGASWADYDNDGDLDLLTVGTTGGSKLFRNNGDGSFTNVIAAAGIRENMPAMTGVFGDYDNDGCKDLYIVLNGREDTLETPGDSDLLYRNNCDGTFSRADQSAGIRDTGHGRGAAWADYDRDGDLDIFVANHGIVKDRNNFTVEDNLLYRNNGDGTFAEVGRSAGVAGGTACDHTLYRSPNDRDWKESYQPAWFDYDNDGDQDLFVATDSDVSPLFRNNGDGTFADATKEAGLCRVGTGMGVAVADYDNDLDLDFYVTNVGFNYLWSNNRGVFSEVAQTVGGADHALGWGVGFLDYDNDGDQDLYVVNGNVTSPTLEVITTKDDKFYRNEGAGVFRQVAHEEGITGGEAKQTGAFADYDNDGFTDMYIGRSHYIDVAQEGANNRLYRNRDNGNRWISFRLTGTASNRDAVGARVYVTAGGAVQMREVQSGGSYLAQNSPWPSFGLGKADRAERVEIRWPSGRVQVLENLPANRFHDITES